MEEGLPRRGISTVYEKRGELGRVLGRVGLPSVKQQNVRWSTRAGPGPARRRTGACSPPAQPPRPHSYFRPTCYYTTPLVTCRSCASMHVTSGPYFRKGRSSICPYFCSGGGRKPHTAGRAARLSHLSPHHPTQPILKAMLPRTALRSSRGVSALLAARPTFVVRAAARPMLASAVAIPRPSSETNCRNPGDEPS